MTLDSSFDGERWSRQMAVPGFGKECQQKLRGSRAAVLGLGGVGGPAALYLAAAGVGSLVLVDRDVVETSNLNRQILFTSRDAGRPKAVVAAERLRDLDPGVEAWAVVREVGVEDLEELLQGCQVALDCFDRNEDRLAVNRVCVNRGIPAVHGFAQDWSGELFTVVPGEGPCLACALDLSFPEEVVVPVMGVATGIVGLAMAAAALRLLTGVGEPVPGLRMLYDLAFPEMLKIPVPANPACPVCGPGKS